MRTGARLRNAIRTLEALRTREDAALRLQLGEAMTPEELHQLALLIRKVIETRTKLERLRNRSIQLREALERFRERQSSI
jgi:hypothetical protein